MPLLSYIKEEDVSRYGGLEDVSELVSMEDLATLLETFEDVKTKVGFDRVSNVLQDDEKYYYFIVSREKSNFDLYDFINNHTSLDFKISCLNAKYVLQNNNSRGIYFLNDEVEEPTQENEDFEDLPTGFLDGDDDGEIKLMQLYNVSTGDYVDIPESGLIVGRSGKSVDYVVKDNIGVGRVHCELYYNDKGCLMVHDCKSLNGTFVKNRKVNPEKDVPIFDGDSLILANVEFKVVRK